MLTTAITLQIVHLLYHQITTLFDFFPFNGARFYSRKEKLLEVGTNLIMMGLPPVGYIFHVTALIKFGVVYYFVLLAVEFYIWWVPYFFRPSVQWAESYSRIHSRTMIVLPRRGNNPIPNLEHMILHGLSLLTAIVTLLAYSAALA